MIEDFKKRMGLEGRTLIWFHKTYVKHVLNSYNYFIMQLSGQAKMHDSVYDIIKDYMAE